jgi:hypothetical protein
MQGRYVKYLLRRRVGDVLYEYVPAEFVRSPVALALLVQTLALGG